MILISARGGRLQKRHDGGKNALDIQLTNKHYHTQLSRKELGLPVT